MYSESIFQKASPPARSTRGTNPHHHLISYSRQDLDENDVEKDSSEVPIGQLRTTIRHVIGSTMEPYLEILRRLDAAATVATKKASDTERIVSKALEIEHITSKHLGKVEDHCYGRVQAMERTVGKLQATFQQTRNYIKETQSQTRADLIAAVQNIQVIQASQRECAKAVEDITNLLLFALYHLSPSSIDEIGKLDLAILRHQGHVSSLDVKIEDYNGRNSLEDSAENNHSSQPSDSISMTTIVEALSSHREELSHLLHPTDPPTSEIEDCLEELRRLDAKPVNQATSCYASYGNPEITSIVDESFKSEHNLYSGGISNTASTLSEVEGASVHAEDNARDTLIRAVSMAQRLQSAQNALHKNIDPLNLSIEQLANDLESFEGMAQNILMDQSEDIYAAAQNITGLLSAQRRCTQLIASFSVILLQVMAHRFNPSAISADNLKHDHFEESGVVLCAETKHARGTAATIEVDCEDSVSDQAHVSGLTFGGETEDPHCVPCITTESLIEPDCGGDQHEETINHANSHVDPLNESEVQLTSEYEELNTQSLSEKPQIDMPRENLTEMDYSPDDGQCENRTVVKPPYEGDSDIYTVADHILPEKFSPGENYLIQSLNFTKGPLPTHRVQPQRLKWDFVALVKDLTSFSPVIPFLEAFLVLPKPTFYILPEDSAQCQEYRPRPRSLVRRVTYQYLSSQVPISGPLSTLTLSDDASSLQTSRPPSRGLWRSGGLSPSARVLEHASRMVLFPQYTWTVERLLGTFNNSPNSPPLYIRWYLFASFLSTQGDQYRIFTVDPRKLVLYATNLLSTKNRTLAGLLGYARMLIEDEVPNFLSSLDAALVPIRSANFLVHISNIRIAWTHIFSLELADHTSRPPTWRRPPHSASAHQPAQVRMSTTRARWLHKSCLCVCVGIFLYCGIRILKFEQNIQWDIHTNQWGNQESRRAYKNSLIRSNFRPV